MLFRSYDDVLPHDATDDNMWDDTGEGNWLEPFWMVAFLKTGVISVVLQSSGTVLLLNVELMIKVILIAGAMLSYSWSC